MIRITIVFSLIYLLLFLNTGCNDSSVEPRLTIAQGKYSYSGYNNNDELVASGFFIISIIDSIITGVKNIHDIGSEHQLESGEGEINGRIIGLNQIEIYLTETGGPFLVIEGKYKDEAIVGERLTGSVTGAWIDTLGIFRSELLEYLR
jgi:hypothetical protein